MTPAGEVLYLSHNGLTEALGRRQVLPYILGLSRKGWRFHTISYEKAETCDAAARQAVQAAVDEVGGRWTALRYHRKPPLAATAFDVVGGLLRGLFGQRPILIHARSSVPAVMASALAARFRCPWIFDVRGLLGREYSEAGHWRQGGLLHRTTDATERLLLRRASGLVFLTERVQADLLSSDVIDSKRPIEVIPCTADLAEFRPDADARRHVRQRLGLEGCKLLVYSGSVGGWYRMPEMADFFRVAREEIADLRFLVLSHQAEVARAAIRDAGVSSYTTLLTLRPEEVPGYLAAADAGICFVANLESKRASSPTKYGEYLGAGLPVITNPWTGDAAALADTREWILVDRLDESAYRSAARSLAALFARPAESVRGARELAERAFSVETAIGRYDRLYRRVLGAQ